MTPHKIFTTVGVAIAIACVAGFTPVLMPVPAAAQANPTMTNVVPDGGNFAIQGKLQAMNAGARTVTIAPEKSPPVPMTVAAGVSLSGISVGDVVSAHYNRSVTFVVGTANVPVPSNTTATVGQLAKTPGGIGPEGGTFAGRVVKLGGPSSFDVVNPDGGGIYTIQTTDPARQALISELKVGDSITVSISPLTVNSIAKCGVFGLGVFGC